MPSIPSMNRAFAGPTNIFCCIHLNRIWLTFQPTKFALWILNLIIEEKHIPAVTHFSCPSKIPLVMNCRIGCFDLNIRATNLRNIVCDQSSLLASQGSGFHERVDFEIRFDSCLFLLPWQLNEHFISSYNGLSCIDYKIRFDSWLFHNPFLCLR